MIVDRKPLTFWEKLYLPATAGGLKAMTPFALMFFCCLVPLMAGCVTPPPISFNVASVPQSIRRVNVEVRSIDVRLANPNDIKEINAVAMEYRGLVPEHWHSAIQDALDRHLLFTDRAPVLVAISVNIVRLKIPNFAFTFKTEAVAEYTITDRSSGAVIWKEVISSIGEDELSMAHVGNVRALSSVNRAVQNNISAFLEKLDNSFLPERAVSTPLNTK